MKHLGVRLAQRYFRGQEHEVALPVAYCAEVNYVSANLGVSLAPEQRFRMGLCHACYVRRALNIYLAL